MKVQARDLGLSLLWSHNVFRVRPRLFFSEDPWTTEFRYFCHHIIVQQYICWLKVHVNNRLVELMQEMQTLADPLDYIETRVPV
jgi:hypothetical protein